MNQRTKVVDVGQGATPAELLRLLGQNMSGSEGFSDAIDKLLQTKLEDLHERSNIAIMPNAKAKDLGEGDFARILKLKLDRPRSQLELPLTPIEKREKRYALCKELGLYAKNPDELSLYLVRHGQLGAEVEIEIADPLALFARGYIYVSIDIPELWTKKTTKSPVKAAHKPAKKVQVIEED